MRWENDQITEITAGFAVWRKSGAVIQNIAFLYAKDKTWWIYDESNVDPPIVLICQQDRLKFEEDSQTAGSTNVKYGSASYEHSTRVTASLKMMSMKNGSCELSGFTGLLVISASLIKFCLISLYC